MCHHRVPHIASSGCFGGHKESREVAGLGWLLLWDREEVQRDIIMWGKISPQESTFPLFGWGWKAHREDLSNATEIYKICTGLDSLISKEQEVMELSLCAGLGAGRGLREEFNVECAGLLGK